MEELVGLFVSAEWILQGFKPMRNNDMGAAKAKQYNFNASEPVTL